MTKRRKGTVRLLSDAMVSAPGMLRWAMNGYRFREDRSAMIRVMQCWPGLTRREWQGVLSGVIPHSVPVEFVQ